LSLGKASESQLQQSVAQLEQQLTAAKEEVLRREGEVSRTQNEVDRLLDILKTTENEKNAKDDQIKELHE
jgi:chromosome segregation ATPase